MPSTIVNNVQNNTLEKETVPLSSRDFTKLTKIDDIRDCLRLLDEEETRIDKSLDDMLAQQYKLEHSLNTLNVLKPQLNAIQLDSSKVIETLDKTSRLAEVISDKVRQLDLEQSRTRQSIRYVEDVQELKYCVARLQEAIMENKDYDAAAVLLQRASKVDPAIINGSLAEFTVVSNHFILPLFICVHIYLFSFFFIFFRNKAYFGKSRSSSKDVG
ncbi:MAG: hypothetical protein EXX96DRAFT_487370 [Benjaminiella poitrasii]|nr:MAG: hypothetical protein EXX96DRAFT_487370 [Benjaminiella poitrasii]